MELQWLRCKSR